jgi:hypothetical protein
MQARLPRPSLDQRREHRRASDVTSTRNPQVNGTIAVVDIDIGMTSSLSYPAGKLRSSQKPTLLRSASIDLSSDISG